MADFNEIKDKVLITLGTVADITKDVAERAADKAKTYARIARLSVEISGVRDNLKKIYIEIGKRYYEAHKADSAELFTQLFEEVSAAMETIAAKEAEIAELKKLDIDFTPPADAETDEKPDSAAEAESKPADETAE